MRISADLRNSFLFLCGRLPLEARTASTDRRRISFNKIKIELFEERNIKQCAAEPFSERKLFTPTASELFV